MWFLIVFFSILYTELVGYIVHRLLHANRLGMLGKLHLEHHLVHYPANGTMKSEEYLHARKTKSWIEKVGWEWIIPITTITIPVSILLMLLGVPLQYMAAGVMVSLLWTWACFDYVHKVFHLKNVWIEKNYIFKSWFKETRKLHFIHHNNMKVNFGITFFWFDKLYETFVRKVNLVKATK